MKAVVEHQDEDKRTKNKKSKKNLHINPMTMLLENQVMKNQLNVAF